MKSNKKFIIAGLVMGVLAVSQFAYAAITPQNGQNIQIINNLKTLVENPKKTLTKQEQADLKKAQAAADKKAKANISLVNTTITKVKNDASKAENKQDKLRESVAQTQDTLSKVVKMLERAKRSNANVSQADIDRLNKILKDMRNLSAQVK